MRTPKSDLALDTDFASITPATFRVNEGVTTVRNLITSKLGAIGNIVSGTDTYTTNLITNLTLGQLIPVQFTNANTGASTLNFNNTIAIPIVKNAVTPLSFGDIPAGGSFILYYDGTNLQLIGNISSTAATAWGAITGTLSTQIDLQSALDTKLSLLGTPFVTPEQYGAVGDGSTDDSTAINNAVATGRTVYFAQKNYRVNSTITLSTSNSALIGNGSTISTTSNISIITITSKKNLLQGIIFLGNAAGAAQTGINVTGNAGLTLDYTSNRVRGCEFKSLNFAGIYSTLVVGTTGSVHQGSIYGTDNYFESCGIGIYLDNRAEYCSFVNSNIYACTTGIKIVAGNSNFTGGHITDGTTGIAFTSGSNDGKCTFTGFSINHNTTAVTSVSVTLSSSFANCELISNGSVTFTNGTGHSFKTCTFGTLIITTTNSTPTEFIGCTFQTTPTLTITGVPPKFISCTYQAAAPPAGAGGLFQSAYIAKTANYTIIGSDYIVDCTANSFTVTLPTAVGITGQTFIIKNSGTATTITIATTSSQTIDGSAPGVLASTLVPLKVMSNGTNYITV